MRKKEQITKEEIEELQKETIKLSGEDMGKLAKKMAKGFRIVACPKCGRPASGQWITEIISCGKCGYKKEEPKEEKNTRSVTV